MVTPAQRRQQFRCHISNLEGVLLPLGWQPPLVILTALTPSGRFSFLSPSRVPPLLPPLLHLGCACLSQASEPAQVCLLFLCFAKLGDTKSSECRVAFCRESVLSPYLGWGQTAFQTQLRSIAGGRSHAHGVVPISSDCSLWENQWLQTRHTNTDTQPEVGSDTRS